MDTTLPYLAALVVGALLSISGATLQSVLRNPLAEPYVLGLVGGAALFSATALHFGWTALGPWVLPAASFLGSCCSLALVGGVAIFAARARAQNGADAHLRSSGSTVTLAGFAVSGLTGSLQMLILSYAQPDTFARFSKWLFGTLAAVTPATLAAGAAVLALTLGTLLAAARQLDVLELGRDEAECLGVNTRRTLFLAVGVVSLATAAAVALAGAIGFLGLVVPHVVRRLFGPRMGRVLPLSALLGGMFLALAQGLGGLLPGDVAVGVVCAVIGAPFFLLLLAARQNGEGRDV